MTHPYPDQQSDPTWAPIEIKDMQHAWKRADWYFEKFCKDRPSWEMDLKAVGDSNEKILQDRKSVV
jgi:hypothetical protein